MYRSAVLLSATALVAAPAMSAPETGAGAKLPRLAVDAWTCPEHQQLRMPAKGACPFCKTDLERRERMLQGADASGDLYPLATCPVSGRKLGEMGPPVVMMYEGREVRFCCAGCPPKFESEPQKYLDKIDRQIIEQQKPHYPATTCMVSGETLGSMGEPVDRVYRNRLIRFCCKMCTRQFERNPDEYLAALDQAVIAGQKEAYPLENCPVSGQPLGSMGPPVDYVVANRLVRFCCSGCISRFYRDPAMYLAKIDKGRGGKSAAKRSAEGHGHGHGHGHDHDHDH